MPRGTSSSGASGVSGGGSGGGQTAGFGNERRPGAADPRSRSRDGRPVTGVAIEREGGPLGSGYSNLGWSYPWYGSDLSWYYGYRAYSPFYSYYSPYYSSRWTWGRYGMWYDPFSPFGYYDPLYVDPYLYGYGGFGYSGGGTGGYAPSSEGSVPREATGSVRLRVKPAHAKVYLDGTLMGTVDEFDGLTSHLAATAGRHEIEVRADGYAPMKLFVNVIEDRTVTARGRMRKN